MGFTISVPLCATLVYFVPLCITDTDPTPSRFFPLHVLCVGEYIYMCVSINNIYKCIKYIEYIKYIKKHAYLFMFIYIHTCIYNI